MSKPHRLAGIREVFGRRELASLIAAGEAGLALNDRWRAIVPAPLAESSRVQTLEGGVLHVSAVNGAVALKLRQMAPSLARRLRECGVAADSLRVVVRPNPMPPRRPAKPRVISPGGVATLDQLAQSLPVDSVLRQAVERLARKHRR